VFIRLLSGQAKHKWQLAFLVFLTLASLVTLFVYVRNTTRFSNRSIQLVMKNMGHNLLILPEQADPLASYQATDEQTLFPDTATHTLAQAGQLPTRYFVSVLQKTVEEDGRRFLLTGIEPVRRADETSEKGNMIGPLQPGQVRLGASIAQAAGLESGGAFQIQGKEFVVAEILPDKGTEADYRVFMPLDDCQELLGIPGQINGILSFLCLHSGSMKVAERDLRDELPKVLPGFQVLLKQDMAQARFLARLTTSKSLYYVLALVLTITILVIVIAGLHEVSDRRHETGILVAMGTSYSYIIALYLSKAVSLALIASVAGFLLGSQLAVWFTTPFLVTKTLVVGVLWEQLPSTIALAVVVVLLSEIIPVIQLLRTDPNQTLREG
jgi:putative ABC transport system permease protein